MSQVKDCNITFHSLGETDRSAMPLGNGECAASVWTEQNGDICLYINRTDALTELDRTVKVGMVPAVDLSLPSGNKGFCPNAGYRARRHPHHRRRQSSDRLHPAGGTHRLHHR